MNPLRKGEAVKKLLRCWHGTCGAMIGLSRLASGSLDEIPRVYDGPPQPRTSRRSGEDLEQTSPLNFQHDLSEMEVAWRVMSSSLFCPKWRIVTDFVTFVFRDTNFTRHQGGDRGAGGWRRYIPT
jgi:hypothetical protein